MIEQAFDVVSDFLVNTFWPKNAFGWAAFLFVLGVIWFVAFGVFVGFRETISIIGLVISFLGIIVGVVAAFFGSRQSGT